MIKFSDKVCKNANYIIYYKVMIRPDLVERAFGYKKRIGVIALVLYILTSILIFSLALMSGEDSSALSKYVTAFLQGVDPSKEKLETDIEKVAVDEISLQSLKAAYYIGEKMTLTVNAVPENYTESLIFSSSDSSKASVNDKGEVVFRNSGEVTVTVTSASGKARGEISIEIYRSRTQIENLDKSKFALELEDELKINDCVQPVVTYAGKPISLDYRLEPADKNVAVTNGTAAKYVMTTGSGVTEVRLIVGDETLLTKRLTVTEERLEEPKINGLSLNGVAIGEQTTVYIGRNYVVGFDLENDDAAVKCYGLKLEAGDKGVASPSYRDSASVVVVTPKACGHITIGVYSRTNPSDKLKEFSLTIIPPPAVAEGIKVDSNGYNVGYFYTLELSVSDNNSTVGYTYTVSGKNCERDDLGRVKFHEAGEYNVVFSSVYYPENTFEFTLIVYDPAREAEIRKQIGHAGLFVMLGVLGVFAFFNLFKKSPYNLVITLISGLTVAGISEICQLPVFSEARGASLLDIIIDFSGYAVGIALAVAFAAALYGLINLRKPSPTVE